MTDNERELLEHVVEVEGFDYAMVYYSDFRSIKDKKFHELRRKFLKARRALREHVGVED